jgi:hypothetical protein
VTPSQRQNVGKPRPARPAWLLGRVSRKPAWRLRSLAILGRPWSGLASAHKRFLALSGLPAAGEPWPDSGLDVAVLILERLHVARASLERVDRIE